MKTKQKISENKERKINVITLGCSKNQVDSEVLMTQLEGSGYEVKHESDEASPIVIVNTCGFIDLAKQESIDTILHYASLKEKKRIDKLYVTGCLSQRYKDDLEKEIPEVDAYFGTLDLPFLLEELQADYKQELIGERKFLTTPSHYAYLKISEGCNRNCSFCAIPLMRGKHISKTIEQIVTEARHLARSGVKEIMLIAQELTYYGIDIYKKRALADLLRALNEVDGIEWIRLHYAYPYKFPIDVLDAINDCEKVCNYLDIPLQHISDPVLKRMKRHITKDATYELINTIRQKCPDITLRTTLLLGFPGETDGDIEELATFIQDIKFDRLGVFQYSHEENTTAYELEDNVSDGQKQERADYIMALQEDISYQLNQDKIGQTFKVLFDRKEGIDFAGRTEADSPEVDNEVLVDAQDNYVRIGDFAQVKVTDADTYDLRGIIN